MFGGPFSLFVLPQTQSHPRPRSFGQFLVDRGILSSTQLMRANAELPHNDTDLAGVLLAQGLLTAAEVAEFTADWVNVPCFRASDLAPDPLLLGQIGVQTCLKHDIVPLWQRDGVTCIATPRPDQLGQIGTIVPTEWGMLRAITATQQDIQTVLALHSRTELTLEASARVPLSESCRSWGRRTGLRLSLILLAIAGIITVTLIYPIGVFTALTAWAGITMLIASAMKLAAFLSFLGTPPEPPSPPPAPGPQMKRPRISVLVPLFRETEVARHLLMRLSRLTYPKSLLDVVLVLEETDTMTRDALHKARLPHWMRVIVVPDGHPRTKPRAMNYALDFCKGDIIGIFDAEDAPDADQLDKVAARFMQAPDDLVCLQGVLDYYNPRQNWLARCFTIEYAAWFRAMMPGMARLGFAIPLGGTTLYFRRAALERLGGWDAHNVTEDADLGFRLARHGYRTEMLHTTTREEANCHLLPWIKQRSRWLKGYMVTYLVHMRRPVLLFQQLGAWKFLGFQAHFVTALSQFLLAPLLWSFWLIMLGLPHPLVGVVPDDMLRMMGTTFFAVELCSMMIAMTAVSAPAHRHLMAWVPTLHLYYPLGVLAAYKALYELVFAPFYWDKTQHGLSLNAPTPSGGRVQFQPGHKSL